jgi:hypothetical protein
VDPARRSRGRGPVRSLAEPPRGRREAPARAARRDIVFGKSKGRDSLEDRNSAAVALGERGSEGTAWTGRRQRTKIAGLAAKPLISFETAKENIWNSLEKAWKKLGISLEKFGKAWKRLVAAPVRRLSAP